MRNGVRYYYTPEKSMEAELVRKGSTFPQVLIIREDDGLKVDPFNTKEFQDLRINEILKKEKFEDLIRKAAWLFDQEDRPVNWSPIYAK